MKLNDVFHSINGQPVDGKSVEHVVRLVEHSTATQPVTHICFQRNERLADIGPEILAVRVSHCSATQEWASFRQTSHIHGVEFRAL